MLPLGVCASMQNRRLPPTRTSIWATGRLEPCGPYQLLKSSGWVHMRQMRSTGASKVRSITMASLDRVLSLIVFLLVVQLIDKVVHAVKACLPDRTVLLYPLGNFFYGRYVEGTGAILRFLPLYN